MSRQRKSNNTTWTGLQKLRVSASYEGTLGMYFSNQRQFREAVRSERGGMRRSSLRLKITPTSAKSALVGDPGAGTLDCYNQPTQHSAVLRAGLSSVVPRGGTGLWWVRAQLMSPVCIARPFDFAQGRLRRCATKVRHMA